MELGGGGSDCDDVIMEIYLLNLGGVFKWWREGGRGVKNAENMMTSYVNDP